MANLTETARNTLAGLKEDRYGDSEINPEAAEDIEKRFNNHLMDMEDLAEEMTRAWATQNVRKVSSVRKQIVQSQQELLQAIDTLLGKYD